MDVENFESGKKKLRIKKNPDTCDSVSLGDFSLVYVFKVLTLFFF